MAKKSNLSVFDKNFAEDTKIRKQVEAAYASRFRGIRDERSELEDEWDRYFSAWSVKHDDNHTYSGRAKLYIPEVRKNVEAQARQLTDSAFPNDDFFDVSVGEGGTKKGALIRKSIARWQIEQADLRTKMHVFNRQEVMLGTSPAYLNWSKKTNHIFHSARDKKTGKIKPTRAMVETFNGPSFTTRDLFRWYAINPLAESHREDGCFEDFLCNYFALQRKVKDGQIPKAIFEEIIKAQSNSEAMSELDRYITRVEEMGLSLSATTSYAGEAKLNEEGELTPESRRYLCTLAFLPMVCPQACEDGEDPEMPLPMMVEIYNGGIVAQIRRNPFWFQHDPYVVGKYILPNVDEFYGQGLAKAIIYMQYELNSTAEQTMDSKTLALNPIALIDPALASQLNDFSVHPGAKWFVRPEGVKFGSLPDLSGTGYQAINQIRTQMQEYSDRTPVLPPQLQGKARTATAADAVERIISVDLKAFQTQNERAVLVPLMEMWESLTDQNIEDNQIVMICGKQGQDWKRKLITKDSVLGRYGYYWKASTQLANKPIQARQMIDFLKVLGSVPPDAQAKLNVNWAEYCKTIYRDMLGLPDADKIFGGSEELQTNDPAMENKMLSLGMEIEVLPGDDDLAHLKEHDARIGELKKDGQEKSDESKQLLSHMLIHQRNLKIKEELKKRMEQQQAQLQQQQMMMAQQGQKKPSTGVQGSGNRTQLSPNTNAGDQASGVRA